MKGKTEYIAVETWNYGIVQIELKELKDWIFQLSKDDLMKWDFTEEELRQVKSLFLRKQLRKTYSPLIYDFAISMLNDMIDKQRVVFEKHYF
ncbi:MAG: hypothetical protein PHT72_05475 [Candidatus Absconditabacteria bacterium]|nr:hypothetical protein [Candidatus Absconditabacteria bacterium]